MNGLNNLNEDALLPDLIAEGSLLDNLFNFDDITLPPVQPDLTAVNRQLESLTIDGNTHSLQLKIERMKRRQLRSSLRTVEQAVQRPCMDAASLRQELTMTQEQQNSINYQFEGDIVALRALTFRCLTRMYQVMAKLLSRTICTPDDDFEMSQMMLEIAQTFQQLHSYNMASYV